MVATGGRVYVIGGFDAADQLVDAVEVADILPGGALSPWRAAAPLPAATSFGHAAALRR